MWKAGGEGGFVSGKRKGRCWGMGKVGEEGEGRGMDSGCVKIIKETEILFGETN